MVPVDLLAPLPCEVHTHLFLFLRLHVMSNNGKVIVRSNVLPLDPLDYDLNDINIRIKELDNTMKGSIGDLQKCHELEQHSNT